MTRLPQSICRAATLLLLVLSAKAAHAQLFVGADAGLSILNQEGHAPPICCGERDSWSAPGGRVGGRLGYRLTGWLFARLDAGVALHHVNPSGDLQLRLVSPDLAFMVGAQAGSERLKVDFAVGGGRRWFSGSVTSNQLSSENRDIDVSAYDVRLSLGVHRILDGGHRLGADLTLAKVMIAENVVMLSLVYTWSAPG